MGACGTGWAATSATGHKIVAGDEAGIRELVAAILIRGVAGLPGVRVAGCDVTPERIQTVPGECHGQIGGRQVRLVGAAPA